MASTCKNLEASPFGLDAFLAAFFPSAAEPMRFRAFKPKDSVEGNHNKPVKLCLARADLAKPAGDTPLRDLNSNRGIYFIPNVGGDCDADISRFTAVFVEKDDISISDQHELLDAAPLPPSIRVETRRSVHAYWLLAGQCDRGSWQRVQRELIEYFNSDSAIKNPSRLMRLPGFDHLMSDPENPGCYLRKVVNVVHFEPERRYSISELMTAFVAKHSDQTTTRQRPSLCPSGEVIGNGHRNTKLFSIAGSLRGKGLGETEIRNALTSINEERVRPRLPATELDDIARGIMRYEPRNALGSTVPVDVRLGVPPLPLKALHGLAGEVVRTLEPHTEADPAALLVQLLAGFGSLIGTTAHFVIEADRHYLKINAVLVGATSKGRKGTSWGQVREILRRVDESFSNCVHDGLSTGEGLISHVRDPQTKRSAIKEKGKIIGYQDEIVDEGNNEKRAFIVEPEFARVLRVMKRDGNTMSSVIRQAWDSDRLSVLTRTPLKATRAHVTIIGHITQAELVRNLEETEVANGFANRFLWLFTARSKFLPEGGCLVDADRDQIVTRLKAAVGAAKQANEVILSEGARELWFEIYPELSAGQAGLLGAVTSRAEAQVRRMACVYALVNGSATVSRDHLDAALALWKYCEDSARYIFGENTGDPIADTIYAALATSPTGMSRTQIRDLFNRNQKASRIDVALRILIDTGLARTFRLESSSKPVEMYRTTTYDINDITNSTFA